MKLSIWFSPTKNAFPHGEGAVLVPVEIPALLLLHYTIFPSSAKWYLKLLAANLQLFFYLPIICRGGGGERVHACPLARSRHLASMSLVSKSGEFETKRWIREPLVSKTANFETKLDEIGNRRENRKNCALRIKKCLKIKQWYLRSAIADAPDINVGSI